MEIASKESIKTMVMQAAGAELSKYKCVIVDQLELMAAFRTKGITG